MAQMAPPELRIIHFNDVYHIESGYYTQRRLINWSSLDPVGGAARFVSLQNEYRDKDRFDGQVELVTLFSGDAFNPSIESSATKARRSL